MASSIGVKSQAFFRPWARTASWPASGCSWPITTGMTALDILRLIDESFTTQIMRDDFATLAAMAGKHAGAMTAKVFSGSVTVRADYYCSYASLLSAMGFENPNDSGATYHGSPEYSGGVYYHLLELDENLCEEDWTSAERLPSGSGGGTYLSTYDKVRFGSLVIDKGIADWCYAPLLWDKMILSFDLNSCTMRFDGQAQDHDRGNGSTYGPGGVGGYSLADLGPVLNMIDAEFKIGTVDGTTLTWQEIGITKFELVLERGLDFSQDTASGLYIMEPQISSHRRVYGGFDCARYSNDNLIDQLDNDKEMKAWIKFTSGTHKFNIYLPSFYLKTVDYSVKGPTVLKPSHQFECHKPASDPFSGDADYLNMQLKKNNEFHVVVSNVNDLNFLTDVD